jgi:NAD(P)-dependent dehydrogenase (short-subunit alcohol dehydrogenase family)
MNREGPNGSSPGAQMLACGRPEANLICSADEVRALYETNIFGALYIIQAALPLLRKQGGGHILGVSSGLGPVTMPLIGYYCSSKWAVEAIHESLALESRFSRV